MQHLRESLLVVDGSDKIRLINESAAAILGDEHAVPGALVGEVSPRLLYSLTTWRQVERGEVAPSTFVAADGARVIQPHFAPLGNIAPGPTLIFLEDTSLMAERVQQGKLAALGRLSASIAHEIRNPVGAMSHAGQLLAESPLMGPDERRLTDIIRNNSERVSTIINNVLQLSRREATKPTRLSLGDWIDEFLAEFCETMQIPRQQIALVEEAVELEVRFDPSHLHQVVWNLCDNAIKYGEARAGISVDLRLGRLSPSNRPFLEVADRGPGIELNAVDRIFEPFFTGRKGGTGLGLFIARELCQLNRADPALFTAQRRRQRLSDCVQRPPALGRIEGSYNRAMTKPAVLVVDDEPDLCELLTITLQRMDMSPSTAGNVATAQRMLKSEAYDLCLTDMQLPDGDGLELVEWIQQYCPTVPVAVITAHGNVETAVRALKLGAFDFVSKPLDLTGLRNWWQPPSSCRKTAAATPAFSDRGFGVTTTITRRAIRYSGCSLALNERAFGEFSANPRHPPSETKNFFDAHSSGGVFDSDGLAANTINDKYDGFLSETLRY